MGLKGDLGTDVRKHLQSALVKARWYGRARSRRSRESATMRSVLPIPSSCMPIWLNRPHWLMGRPSGSRLRSTKRFSIVRRNHPGHERRDPSFRWRSNHGRISGRLEKVERHQMRPENQLRRQKHHQSGRQEQVSGRNVPFAMPRSESMLASCSLRVDGNPRLERPYVGRSSGELRYKVGDNPR